MSYLSLNRLSELHLGQKWTSRFISWLVFYRLGSKFLLGDNAWEEDEELPDHFILTITQIFVSIDRFDKLAQLRRPKILRQKWVMEHKKTQRSSRGWERPSFSFSSSSSSGDDYQTLAGGLDEAAAEPRRRRLRAPHVTGLKVVPGLLLLLLADAATGGEGPPGFLIFRFKKPIGCECFGQVRAFQGFKNWAS